MPTDSPAVAPPVSNAPLPRFLARAGRVLRGAVIGATLAAAGLGLYRAERWAAAQPEASAGFVVQWVDLPAWLCTEDNRHILEGLTAQCGIRAADRFSDAKLVRTVFERLGDPQAAWIASIDRVSKHAPNLLVVQARYRQPYAWVRSGDSVYLVDRQGVRLPGRYRPGDERGSGLKWIEAPDQPVPPVGARWPGERLHESLAVLACVEGFEFSPQITGVAARQPPDETPDGPCEYVLSTDRPGSNVWWGRAPGREGLMEIAADRKTALLTAMYEHWGRVDMGRATVNITAWPDRVTLPESGEVHVDGPIGRG